MCGEMVHTLFVNGRGAAVQIDSGRHSGILLCLERNHY